MSRDQHVRDALARFLAAVRQATDTHLHTLSDELLAIVRAEGAPDADGATHLVAGIRLIDEATTLRGVLDALAASMAQHAPRTGVLLVDRAEAKPYRHAGFPPDRTPAQTTAGQSGVLARAIASQVAALGYPGDDPNAPAFLRVPDAQVQLLMPIVVAHQVVAVVHAEGAASAGDRDRQPPDWAALVETLGRHASAKLENVTSKRTVEVLTGSG
jgi:hypothetical protein